MPLAFLAHSAAPKKWRNGVLLLASLFFYAWGEPVYVFLMLFSIGLDFSAGRLIEGGRRRLGLLLSISMNVLLLAFFKYFNFIIDNVHEVLLAVGSMGIPDSIRGIHIPLPIGISFFTFQTMSYSMDVYFGKVKAAKRIVPFAAYVSMFPQLIAGPIVRYSSVAKSLEEREFDWDQIAYGLKRFIIGLAKKVLIANHFALIADTIFALPGNEWSIELAWIGILAYTIQIFFDFSGYSDMAIGLGAMFGFKLPENFNYPYIASSIKDFWRRWHITLSSWFRDYLYIPLGGSRKGLVRTYVNLGIVFLVTGLWHGAAWNFMIWGIIHGSFLIIERLLDRPGIPRLPKPLAHLYTLLVVVFAWVFFRADSLSIALDYCAAMFNFSGGLSDTFNVAYFMNAQTWVTVPVTVVLCTPWVKNIILSAQKRGSASKGLQVMEWLFYAGILLLCLSFIAANTYNPFIYFRF